MRRGPQVAQPSPYTTYLAQQHKPDNLFPLKYELKPNFESHSIGV